MSGASHGIAQQNQVWLATDQCGIPNPCVNQGGVAIPCMAIQLTTPSLGLMQTKSGASQRSIGRSQIAMISHSSIRVGTRNDITTTLCACIACTACGFAVVAAGFWSGCGAHAAADAVQLCRHDNEAGHGLSCLLKAVVHNVKEPIVPHQLLS